MRYSKQDTEVIYSTLVTEDVEQILVLKTETLEIYTPKELDECICNFRIAGTFKKPEGMLVLC